MAAKKKDIVQYYGTGRRKSSVARVFLVQAKEKLQLMIVMLTNICHTQH